jgi:hypothetical protein
MKKQIIVATGLAVLSTSAWATKSRMEALGQDSERGSLYIQDSRNLFRNAAHVNTFKNYVVTEWGTAAANNPESASTPTAEGGFFREMGAFSYGVYLGNENDAESGIRNQRDATGGANAGGYGGSAIAMGAAGFQDYDNPLDLFFGGDMGIQWGARISYAKGEVDTGTAATKTEHSAMGLGLGIVMGDLDVYGSMKLKDESKGDGTTADAKYEAGGMQLGLGYNLGDLRVYADYAKQDAEYTSAAGAAKNETDQTSMIFGVAKTHEVSSSSRVWYSLSYNNTKGEDKDGAAATNNQEQTNTRLLLGVGMEAEANSWLTLRGSVTGPFMINETETKTTTTNKQTNANQVDVNAGATLSFGKLKIDGSIGTSASARNGALGTDSGVLTTDNLLSRVAVHYWF